MSVGDGRARHRRRSWPLAVAFALMGLAGTATGALRWQHSIEEARVHRVDEGVATSVEAVTTALTGLSNEARNSLQYFSRSNPQRGSLFDWASRYMAAQTEIPGMSALLYIDRVAHADIAAYTEQFHAEVGTALQLLLAPGSEHEIIARGQPTQVLGVDVRMVPAVQPLLDAASATDGAVVVVAPKEVTDFLPLDKPNEAFVIGLADRNAAGEVVGWGLASFSGPGLINVAHRQMPVAFGVSAETEIDDTTLVLGSIAATGPTGAEVVRRVEIAGVGTPIVLRITPSRVFHDRFLASGPQGLLVSGTAVALLLALLMQVIASSRSRALDMVDEATADLSASERRLASLVDHAADAIAIVDSDLVVHFITPAVETLINVAVADVIGKPLSEALPFEDVSALAHELLELGPRATTTSERVLLRGDGADLVAEVTATNLVDDRAVGGYVLTIHDVTDRKLYEQLLHHQAGHDPLTGLPNRSRLNVVVDGVREAAHRRSNTYAVLYVDLDRFKEINDDYGHRVGDDVLRIVASRLGAAVRPADTVFRIGGDEFVVICPGADATTGRRVADRIETVISEPLVVDGLDLGVGASIGVVVGVGADDPDDLLLAADRAMYQRKAAHRI